MKRKLLAALLAMTVVMSSMSVSALGNANYTDLSVAVTEDAIVYTAQSSSLCCAEGTFVYIITEDGETLVRDTSLDMAVIVLEDAESFAVLDQFDDSVIVTSLIDYEVCYYDEYCFSYEFTSIDNDLVYVLENVSTQFDSIDELYVLDGVSTVLSVTEEQPYMLSVAHNQFYLTVTDAFAVDSLSALAMEYTCVDAEDGYTVNVFAEEEITSEQFFSTLQTLYSLEGVEFVGFDATVCEVYITPHLVFTFAIGAGCIGDITGDGVVSVADVVVMSRYAASVEAISDEDFESCDLYVDGVINVSDALVLMRYLVDIEEELPVYPAE